MAVANAYRLLKVADAIRRSKHYDQGQWSHLNCGAPACIAGHAAQFTLGPGETMYGGVTDLIVFMVGTPEQRDQGRISERAQNWLGLSYRQQRVLFDGDASEWSKEFGERWVASKELNDREDRMIVQRSIAADYLEQLAERADHGELEEDDKEFAISEDDDDGYEEGSDYD